MPLASVALRSPTSGPPWKAMKYASVQASAPQSFTELTVKRYSFSLPPPSAYSGLTSICLELGGRNGIGLCCLTPATGGGRRCVVGPRGGGCAAGGGGGGGGGGGAAPGGGAYPQNAASCSPNGVL